MGTLRWLQARLPALELAALFLLLRKQLPFLFWTSWTDRALPDGRFVMING